MIETLKYIGRWFIRFILIAIIFSTFQSCAKAYTFSDFSNFVDQVQGQPTNDRYVNDLVNVFRGSKNAILTLLANNGKSTSNYNYFAIKRATTSSTYDFYLATNDIVEFLPSGNYGAVKYDPYGIKIRLTYDNNHGWQATTQNWNNSWHSNQGCSAFIGLNNTANYKGDSWQRNGYNKVYWWVVGNYNPITYLQYNTEITDNTHNGSLFTYYFQGNLYGQSEIKLGDITINDSYYYEVRLRNSNTNVIIGTIFYDVNTNNTYNDGAIYQDSNKNIYVTTRFLNYSTQYQLEVESYYGDGGTNLYEDIDWYIFLPNNAIISGDSIEDFGNGEFTTQDSTNAIIDNQDENQEDNQSFLDNLYNQMFTVSGEQVQQIINTTIERVQIPSGEIAEIEQIFNYLSGDAGDFVISWTDKTTHFTVNGANIHQLTIPARQINFSEMERQSPELQQAMHWARLITNISIFSILIHEAYICLLATLGVPVAIYGQKLEEKQQLAAQQQKQEQAWQNRLEQQRYNDWLYSHRKR